MIPAIRRLGPVLVQLYGRFEGGWPLTVLGTDAHAAIADGDETLARSCGSPIPGIELEVRDIDGSPRGELRVRGPSVVTDYADPDGWCALGDLVTTDADGRFYLHGRLDGMINTASYHVYPAEVETAIATLAGVQDVLVRGEPDPVRGEAVTAYLITDNPPPTPEASKPNYGTSSPRTRSPRPSTSSADSPPDPADITSPPTWRSPTRRLRPTGPERLRRTPLTSRRSVAFEPKTPTSLPLRSALETVLTRRIANCHGPPVEVRPQPVVIHR